MSKVKQFFLSPLIKLIQKKHYSLNAHTKWNKLIEEEGEE